MRRKTLLLLTIFSLLCNLAFSQGRTVSGVVLDAFGAGVPNASIIVKGTSIGVATKSDGAFQINLPQGKNTIVISAIGYVDIEKTVAGDNIIISLSQNESKLDEVVVAAYGTVKRRNAAVAISQINADAIKNRPLTNVSGALDGLAPGIQVTSANGQPGSGQSIRIRGFGSINASNDPLYVVDGVPYTGAISSLNMDDVESISVLKDAGATALYGSRGSNGVVIITTKKGQKNISNLSFKSAIGFVQRGIPEYDRVNAYQYYPLMWQALKNSLQYSSGQTSAVAAQNATNRLKANLGYNPFNVGDSNIVKVDGTLNPDARLLYLDDLNWYRDIARTGLRQEYGIGYSGGNDKSDYYGSLGYTKEQGFAIRSDVERYNARLGVNTNPVKWFKTGLNVAATLSKSNTASDGTSTAYVNPFFFARNMGPIYPVYAHNPKTGEYLFDANGNKIYDLGNMTSLGIPARGAGASPGRHILAETRYNEELFKRTLLSGRGYGTLYFTPWLNFTTNIGVDQTQYRQSIYGNKIVGDAAPTGRVSKDDQILTSYTLNELLKFNKSYGQHNIDVLAGHENYALQLTDFAADRSGQIFDGNTELINFSTPGGSSSYTDNQRIESYLSSLNYNFNSKYFLTGSFRRDGNSRFKKEFRWANFWSVSGAWAIDRENFMKSVDWISSLKLRSSYGKVGNDGGIYYYAYQALYSLGYNNGNDPGVIQTNLRNDSITWESSKNFDLALDFSLFKNRLNASVEYYNRLTDGLIFSVPLPIQNGGTPSGGYSLNKNIGSLNNHGFEIHVDGDIIRNNEWKWNLGVNINTLKNEITKMPNGQSEIISGTKKYSVGHSIYDYWLREWMGVDSADGLALYRSDIYNATTSRIKANGDTVTTSSNNGRYKYAGSAIPKLWGSITTMLKYKAISVEATLTYQIGGLMYDGVYAGLMTNGSSYGAALHTDALLSWKKPGDITNVPRMDNAKGTDNNAASTRWLIDASYLNIRNISFSYNLPKFVLNRMHSSNARFFVNVENLAMFSRRKGMNPQQAFSGVNSNVYTPGRITTFGVNINF